MRKIDRVWFALISELFVNLSAGWIAAALALAFSAAQSLFLKILALTINSIIATFSLLAAYWLRKKLEK